MRNLRYLIILLIIPLIGFVEACNSTDEEERNGSIVPHGYGRINGKLEAPDVDDASAVSEATVYLVGYEDQYTNTDNSGNFSLLLDLSATSEEDSILYGSTPGPLSAPNNEYELIAISYSNRYGAKISQIELSSGKEITIGPVIISPIGSISGYFALSNQCNHTGIHVSIPGTSLFDTTDFTGFFTISGVPEGEYDLKAGKDGYSFAILSNVSAKSDQTAAVQGQELIETDEYVEDTKSEEQIIWESMVPAELSDDPSFCYIEDEPDLPTVLLIGDSISIGYTVPVRKFLLGKANVHRIPESAGSSTRGHGMLPIWLANKEWDVIHFNWGLHDLEYQIPIGIYENDVETNVKILKETEAKLIFATTTPYTEGSIRNRTPEDCVQYNLVAKKIMDAYRVSINDLYAFALPLLDEIQKPDDVHFFDEGYDLLGEEVAARILLEINSE